MAKVPLAARRNRGDQAGQPKWVPSLCRDQPIRDRERSLYQRGRQPIASLHGAGFGAARGMDRRFPPLPPSSRLWRLHPLHLPETFARHGKRPDARLVYRSAARLHGRRPGNRCPGGRGRRDQGIPSRSGECPDRSPTGNPALRPTKYRLPLRWGALIRSPFNAISRRFRSGQRNRQLRSPHFPGCRSHGQSWLRWIRQSPCGWCPRRHWPDWWPP